MIRVALFPIMLLAACSPGEPAQPAAAGEFRQWKLPRELREISGLALTADQRLLAVSDELAIVYELDYSNGRAVKSFALGDPVLRGDFEGIAVLRDRVWLMTSDGDLFRFAEGEGGSTVPFERFPTGHGDYCELEGLAQIPERESLLLVCKETRSPGDELLAFEWSVAEATPRFLRQVELPQGSIARRIDEKRVNPSAAAVDPASGDWVMLAARQRALFRTLPDGELAAAGRLPNRRSHRQAEGLEIGRDGRVLIADEGGDGSALLSVYPAIPAVIARE